MAKPLLREKALSLRKKGMSYSQIKEKLDISKSTLSVWLKEYPLSQKRINELRAWSERRIERCRVTKAKKKEARLNALYTKTKKNIGNLSNREKDLAAAFLYWAEGTKASYGVIQMTNTDPAMVTFFVEWLKGRGCDVKKIRVYVHLYSDMDIKKSLRFWSKTLNIPLDRFRKPYVKEAKYKKGREYVGRFGHGTCNIIYSNRELYEELMASIAYLREGYVR